MTTIIKNKCSLPMKVHLDRDSNTSDYIIYPGNRAEVRDVKGCTLSFDTKIDITTRRRVGSCIPRVVKKKVKNIDSVDILSSVSKITLSN